MSSQRPHDCLVILSVGSHRLSATVAWRRNDVVEVNTHRTIECPWASLPPSTQASAVAEVLQLAATSAGIRPHSVFVSLADPSLRAAFATGWADLGQELVFTDTERNLALARAGHQAIGTERELLHVLPQRWSVRSGVDEHEVEDPVGKRGSRITCNVLLVTALRETRQLMTSLLKPLDIYLEGLIAQPVGLYKSLLPSLPARGSTVIIDCGAQHTNLIVHRKGRLVHIETHRFGGDDLTAAIAATCKIDLNRAEVLKKEVDISVHRGAGAELPGQQYIWTEVHERQRLLGPAARLCHDRLQEFFSARVKGLRDLELLAQQCRVHLAGRAAAMGGLSLLLRELFNAPVILGSNTPNREPSAELADLLTVGLIRQAAEERARLLQEHAPVIEQARSHTRRFWRWLMQPLD